VPFVVSPHGVLTRWGRENRRPILKSASIRYVEAPLLRHAAKVQFTSRRELEEFSQLGIVADTQVIPLAMSAASGSASGVTHQPPPHLHALSGRPVVLFLARIHPVKNLDSLLRAFAGVIVEHPSVVLWVAGDGEPTVLGGLRALAADLGIEQHVQWVGFAKGEFKQWLFSRANVFVLPSWSENFGLAVAEAMAAGVPVIVTRGVGISDIVTSHQCGLVTDCTVPALQQAMESLIGDEAIRTRMGNAGKLAVREELSIEIYAERLERMYRSAASHAAARI